MTPTDPEYVYTLPKGSEPPVRIEFENEPEPINLSPITLRQKLALWRIIFKAWFKRVFHGW